MRQAGSVVRNCMKPLIFIIPFITVLLNSIHGQKLADPNKYSGYKDYQKCVYTPKYSASQRKKFYPFDIVDTIKLVSFRYHKNDYPIKGENILFDSLIEIKSLDKPLIDSLTDILYNNFYYYKQKCCIAAVNQCFFPRNAILFLDKNGFVKEYVLICFQCSRIEKSSDKISFGDQCTEEMEKLLKFFLSLGLKFGTNTKVDSYPGETSTD